MKPINKFSWYWKLNNNQDIIKNKNNYNVFSCFAGVGGSSMGYKLAGFNIIGINEIDKKMVETYKLNNNVKYIFNLPIQELINKKELLENIKGIDILDGSPPCSNFSMSGNREKDWGKLKKFREGQSTQILDNLFYDFIKIAEIIKPKIVVSENVKGLISGNAKGYVSKIIDEFKKIGYKTKIFLLNSKYMNVPQSRERVFFISTKKEMNNKQLKFNFNNNQIPFYKIEQKVNTIGKPLGSKIIKLWHNVKKGKSFGNYYKINSYFSYIKIDPLKVCPTIIANNKVCHYKKPHYLSKEAVTLIQSFPIDFNYGKINHDYACGMSVPPLMMANIATEIKNQLLV